MCGADTTTNSGILTEVSSKDKKGFIYSLGELDWSIGQSQQLTGKARIRILVGSFFGCVGRIMLNSLCVFRVGFV